MKHYFAVFMKYFFIFTVFYCIIFQKFGNQESLPGESICLRLQRLRRPLFGRSKNLSIFSKEHRNVPPVNHQQKCIITEFVVFST